MSESIERDEAEEGVYTRILEVFEAQKATGYNIPKHKEILHNIENRQFTEKQLCFIQTLFGHYCLDENEIRKNLDALNQEMISLRQRLDRVYDKNTAGGPLDFQQMKTEVEEIIMGSSDNRLLKIYSPTCMTAYGLPLSESFGSECEDILELFEDRQTAIRFNLNETTEYPAWPRMHNSHPESLPPLRLPEEVRYRELHAAIQKDLKGFELLFDRISEKRRLKKLAEETAIRESGGNRE